MADSVPLEQVQDGFFPYYTRVAISFAFPRNTIHEGRFTAFSPADFFSILSEGKGQLNRLQGTLRVRRCLIGITLRFGQNSTDRPHQLLQ